MRHTLILLAVPVLGGVSAATGQAGAQESGGINLTIEAWSSELEPGAVQTYGVIGRDERIEHRRRLVYYLRRAGAVRGVEHVRLGRRTHR